VDIGDALGLARPIADVDALLEEADFVTLHVPATPRTADMMGPKQFARMRQGSDLLNMSRGKVRKRSAASVSKWRTRSASSSTAALRKAR